MVPLLAFTESCIGIGLFVSGAVLLLVTATLYNSGLASLETILPLAFIGAMLGDHVGYYCGRLIGPRIHHFALVGKYQAMVLRSEELIRSHGNAAVFIGRFIPAIRSIIPALVGISGIQRMRFSLLDALACFTWTCALALILIGIDEIF